MSAANIIYNTAIADGMPERFATLMVAWSQHETGNYSSRFFTVGNNAFGYSYVAGSRWQLLAPGPKADNGAAIAQYATVQDSVHEITSWIRRRQNEGKFPQDLASITTGDQLAAWLKKNGYYGADQSDYAAALNRWLATAGQYIGDSAPWLLIAVLGAIAYRYRARLFSRG